MWFNGTPYGQFEKPSQSRLAANLLMPLDDFRRQIGLKAKVNFCSERYRVSLIGAILRWLIYTERRAVLVVSRWIHSPVSVE